MSTGSKKRTRSERVASVELPPGLWGSLRMHLKRGHVLVRLALCAVVAVVLWVITQGWLPPQPYHLGDIPPRDITSRVQFEKLDEKATAEAREQARKLAVAWYEQDPTPISQLRAKLENDVSQIVAAEDFASVEPLWSEFEPQLAEGTPAPTQEERQQQFERFRDALKTEGALENFKKSLAESTRLLEQNGILDALPADHDANFERIAVRQKGSSGFEPAVAVNDVLKENASTQLQKSLEQKMPSLEIAQRVFAWMLPKLPITLTRDVEATRAEQQKAADAVAPKTTVFPPGSLLAEAGREGEPVEKAPLDSEEMELIRLEHMAHVAHHSWRDKAARSLAVLGMYVALYVLCGFYVYYREPCVADELSRLAILLSMVVVTVSLMIIASSDDWRAEAIPLMLFGMTMAIAYDREFALLLSSAVTLIGTQAIGLDLGDAVVMLATTVGAILCLGRVRTRSKLLSVGFVAAGVAALTTLGVGTMEGQPLLPLLRTASVWALWAVVAGSLMTCLLPLVERLFGVQTDLSLIELGDPAHPLLQELVRRAPGTYNHSITVASLAEKAAESIGARGLLVRVGAYFHDIGKMLKPGYFVENQGQGDNRHQSLLPAMSTLVIIAHVKDGADLARQNGVPEPIIDFIQQHHGTTLVEYFYRQAAERSSRGNDIDGSNVVDESSFRYPGPKPQTKEAGILMLSDAVESASRVLVEPTPARIESLVDDISRKRLLDGQFDESGLTLEEVDKIGQSLVKSLTAVYHGRVKYPDQETA
ncbi:MAG: HD family phosphohydrolase [Pirellulales bacterium]